MPIPPTTILRGIDLRAALLLSGSAVVTLIIFLVDMAVPLGVADTVPYVFPILVSIWLPWRRAPLVFAAGATALIALGYFLSPPVFPGIQSWVPLANRLLAAFAVWVTAILCFLRQRYAGRLEREQARLRAVIDTSADAVVTIDERGRIQSFSRAGERLFGHTEAEVLGRNVGILMPEPYRSQHDAHLERYRRTGKSRVVGVSRMVDAQRKDGSVFPVHLMLGEVEADGRRLFTGFLHDMTARIQAEQAVANERNFVATILDTTQALVVVMDRERRIVRFNRACEQLTGYRAAEVVGRPVWSFIPGDVQERERAAAAMWSCVPTARCEIEWMNRAGERRLIAWSSSGILDDTVGVRFVVATGIDITEQERARRKVQELQLELYRIGRLSELGEMASAIAHELNQPLTAISNFVRASQKVVERLGGEASASVSGLMGKAVQQTDRAGQIIRRLRQLIGRGHAELLPVQVNDIVRDACALACLDTHQRAVRVDLDLTDALPPVLADAIQIQQVVFNLLRNGVDAMANSERREILVRTAAGAGGAVEVSVSDTGPGLQPEVEARLFMPFVTTKPNGMGIGLSICRSIIDAHDGRIWARPNPGGGATFAFALPAHESTEERND